MINQRQMLKQFCAARGLAVDEWVEEIGGGLSFKRQKFLSIVDWVISGEIEMLIIAHQDRLVRFGFPLLAHLCSINNGERVVMNSETVSPEQERVEDLMWIVHCFSSRLDGLRKYRQSLQKAPENDTSAPDTAEADA